jgi:hypothetical protein
MKTLPRILVLAGLFTVGLLVGLRPPEVAKPVLASFSPAPSSLARLPALPRPTAFDVPAGGSARPSAEVELTRALRSGSAADRDRALQVLLPDLIARDPSLAGHFALGWEPGPVRDELLREVIRQWAATDIGGVITWTTSLLNEADRQTVARAATGQVAQDDPAGAIELAQLLRVGLDDGSVERMAQLWTEEKPREAVEWIARRPADAVRDRLVARIAWTRAQSEPAEAAGLVLAHMTPGEARDDALLGVVRQWAVRDPAPATAWVAQFPAGALHARALAELATAAKRR